MIEKSKAWNNYTLQNNWELNNYHKFTGKFRLLHIIFMFFTLQNANYILFNSGVHASMIMLL